MKILVINPNTTLEMTKSIGEMAEKYCARGTEITAISPDWGPRSIEGHFEEYLSAMATVETVAKYKEDYDAFVIACYGDPGVSACREVTEKPVVGIGEASMHMACFVGHKFSVVTVIPRIKPLLEDLVKQLGLTSKCASIRATNLSVLEIEEDPETDYRESRYDGHKDPGELNVGLCFDRVLLLGMATSEFGMFGDPWEAEVFRNFSYR